MTWSSIFHCDGTGLSIRYLHYYIQIGHGRMRTPLDRDQKHALSAVESLLARLDFRVEFNLEPERRRHYLRLWLTRRT